MTQQIINEKFKKDLFGVSKYINTFYIMTPENPMAFTLPAASNNELCDKFEEFIEYGAIMYKKLNGTYGNKEHSYFLANIKLDMAKRLAGQCSQQAFIFAKREYDAMCYSFYSIKENYVPKKTIQYYDHNGKLYQFPIIGKDGYELRETKKTINYTPDLKDMFSRYHEFKFNIPFSELATAEKGIAKRYANIANNPNTKVKALKTVDMYMESCLNDEEFNSKIDWQNRRDIIGLEKMILAEKEEMNK